MRFERIADLILLNLLVIVLIAAIIFLPSGIVRIILGVPFVVFFLGYALVAALFPRRGVISGIERIALSIGLSISVVSLLGLIINYTPWGISLGSILGSAIIFIFAMSGIVWVRRRSLAKGEAFSIQFHWSLPNWGNSIRAKVLSISLAFILVVTAVVAMGALGYTITQQKSGERFTEFYLLTPEGRAKDYPKKLVLGEKGKVNVSIVNNEHMTVKYQVEVRIDGVRNNEVGPVSLKHGEKWAGEVSYTPTVGGETQKVEFLLQREGIAGPYIEPLRLWIDVVK